MAGGFNNRITIGIALAVGLGLIAVVLQQLSAPPENVKPAPDAPPKLGIPVHHETPVVSSPNGPKAKLVPLTAIAKDSAKGSPGTFEGEVHDRVSGAGVAGASLTFAHGDGAFSATTDASGRFTMQPRETGEWRLAEISANRYRSFRPDWGQSPLVFVAEDGKRVEGLQFMLEPAVDYRGEVVDPEGNGVDGAEVTLHGEHGEQGHWTTANDGGFAFYAPTDSTLFARKTGFGTGRGEVDYKVEVSHRLTITLPTGEGADDGPAQHHTGTVVDDQGLGIGDALIVVQSKRPWITELTTVSSADGAFAFEVPSNRSFVVTASHPGYTDGFSEESESPLRLVLGSGGRIVGHVSDAAGAPVPAFSVLVFRRRGLERETISTTSVVDGHGDYKLSGVELGDLSVTAIAAGLAPGKPVDLRLEKSGEGHADFKLGKGGDVDGLVTDKVTHQPIAGAVVQAEGNPGAGLPVDVEFQARSGPDGRFHLSGMPEKAKSLWCAAEGHHPRILSGVTAHEGQSTPVQIELTPLQPGEDPKIELVGIGAVLRAEGDAILVAQPVPGGGAAEAGLQPLDEIVSVDGATVAELGFNGAVEAIRGPENTTVRLQVRREGVLSTYDVPRRAIQH